MNYAKMFDLSGKTAIVTGGSRGIGRELALALAANGADVCVVVRSTLALAEELVQTLAQGGGSHFAIQADVSQPDDVQRIVTAARSHWGRIDILVNNAGIIIPAPAEEGTLADWRQTMSVNLDGVFLMSQGVGRVMIEQKSGCIINIGSMSGLIVNWPFRHTAYNVSKAGVHMLTKGLAVEWAEHNIRVNAIAPGYIRTELTDVVLKEHPDVVHDHWEKGAVMNRIGLPSELAGSVVYLASNAGSFTTGEVITIDGGLTLR